MQLVKLVLLEQPVDHKGHVDHRDQLGQVVDHRDHKVHREVLV